MISGAASLPHRLASPATVSRRAAVAQTQHTLRSYNAQAHANAFKVLLFSRGERQQPKKSLPLLAAARRVTSCTQH